MMRRGKQNLGLRVRIFQRYIFYACMYVCTHIVLVHMYGVCLVPRILSESLLIVMSVRWNEYVLFLLLLLDSSSCDCTLR
jgi:hypothetical protein